MPTHNTTPSRRVVLSGMVAGAPQSKMAISLVDEAGRLLDRACVNEDGSCELSEEALASAHGVLLERVNVLIGADQFRQLIATDEPVDIAELLAATGQPANSPCSTQDRDGPRFTHHTDPIGLSDPIGL